MIYDAFGRPHCTEKELADLLYLNPELDLSLFEVDDPELYNDAVKSLYVDNTILKKYTENIPDVVSLDQFDAHNQSNWRMPDSYKQLDIAEWVLSQCKQPEELQRVGRELIMYQERNLFNLLKFLKYLVDTLRKNNVVWGVGRGSSVASYVLYLIGVHRINSLYFDLDINEFLK